MVQVDEIDARRSYTTAASKAARDTDFYRIEHEMLDPLVTPPQLIEVLLSKVEADAIRPIDELIANASDSLTIEARIALAQFIAIQFTRGRAFRARIQQMANDGLRLAWAGAGTEAVRHALGDEVTDDEVAENVEAVRMLERGELYVEEPLPRVMTMAFESAFVIGQHLLQRKWGVWITGADLWTTDEPVVPVGGRMVARGQVGGMETAHIVLFPLDPRHLLVMTHPVTWSGVPDGLLTSAETDEVNLELLAHASRWRISRPRSGSLPVLPPPVPPSIMQRDIPLEGSDGTLVHSFSPNRWLYAPQQPWPVRRWWPSTAFVETPPSPWATSARIDGDRIVVAQHVHPNTS